LPIEQEALDVRRQVRMALVAVTTCHLDQLEAMTGSLVGIGEFAAQTVDDRTRLFQQLGKQFGWYRLDGHHQNRLDGSHRVRVGAARRRLRCLVGCRVVEVVVHSVHQPS
jgi:hypothetical protein